MNYFYLISSMLLGASALPTGASSSSNSQSGAGVYVSNSGWTGKQTYNFYQNFNGYGALGTAMVPTKSVEIEQGQEAFVSLPDDFEGRVQRGSSQIATWVEIRMTDPNGIAWGDISLEAGYNGPATVQDAAGTGALVGFTTRLIPLARAAKDAATFADWTTTTDTGLSLKATGPNGEQMPDLAAWLTSALTEHNAKDLAYIAGGNGVNLAQSTAHQLRVKFY